ncbi:MAG: FAD:protein FMN transferase, partial [Leptospirales bacterium]
LRLNLSAIAKGYAVDRIFALHVHHPLQQATPDSGSAPTKTTEARTGAVPPPGAPAAGSGAAARGAVPAVMVEIGGEVRVGRTIGGRPWRLGIERPVYEQGGGQRAIFRVTELENTAMATSGDYRNYFVSTDDGARYSHILDPRTGRPEATGVAQATVIGPDCMRADALATTLLVLGEAAGLEMIASESGYEALLLIAEPDRSFRTAMSAGMARWLRPE